MHAEFVRPPLALEVMESVVKLTPLDVPPTHLAL
jgi:hypothetical protein